MNEFPCRTKTVSCSRYYVELSHNGIACLRTSYQTEAEAQKWIERMNDIAPGKYVGKITPEHWTEEICIECGQEARGW